MTDLNLIQGPLMKEVNGMLHRLRRGLSLIVILTVGFSTIALADSMNMDNGKTQKMDGISAKISLNSEKVKTGNNDIMVTLTDSSGKPITDGVVEATARMDKNMSMDMTDKKPIAIQFDKSDDMGRYMGKVDLTDKGKWIIKAQININGQMKNMESTIDVTGGSNAGVGIITGFGGLILLILVIAVIQKKKSAKTKA